MLRKALKTSEIAIEIDQATNKNHLSIMSGKGDFKAILTETSSYSEKEELLGSLAYLEANRINGVRLLILAEYSEGMAAEFNNFMTFLYAIRSRMKCIDSIKLYATFQTLLTELKYLI